VKPSSVVLIVSVVSVVLPKPFSIVPSLLVVGKMVGKTGFADFASKLSHD